MKKTLGYYFLLLSSIIGAGLITGQEVISFFGGFSFKTCIAIVFSSVLIGYLVYKALGVSKSESYQKIKKNKLYQIFVVLSCVVVAGAMVAGVDEFSARTALPSCVGIIVLVLAGLFGGKFSNFFKKFSKIICVLIVIAFIVVVSFAAKNNSALVQVKGTHTFVKCFCYASFNVFLLLPLAEESGRALTKKQNLFLSILLALTLCIYIIVGCYAASFVGGSMPLITVASNMKWFYYVYVIMAFLAILTTLFSSLYSIKQVCGKRIILYLVLIALIFVVSLFGFEYIIEYLYLVIGIIGSIVLFLS